MTKLKAITSETISAMFVLLFLYTAISKLTDYNGFASAISHSALIGSFSYLLAWLIPLIEAIAVILLFVPYTRYMGLIVSTILMALFTGYTVSIFFFAPTFPCTCGGIIQKLSWRGHLALNSFFLVSGIVGIKAYKDVIAINRRSRIPAT